ncbi:MAG: GMC family oxidoreductase [Saprospiraceae bacterium]|nr:GMC family oxidoreductase [Saprospiraceae bacterium]
MTHLNLSAKKHTYDAIVIGSGISGGWAAKELTEKGMKTLMLDRGKPLEHVTGYGEANLDPWAYEHRERRTIEEAKDYYIQMRKPYFSERTKGYWFKDADAPYTETKRFDWFRPSRVGGKSLLWGRQCYRLGDIDFEANVKDGLGADWPVRYKDLEKWYDYVERFVGISGENLDLDHFPNQQLLPPMDLNIVEKSVKVQLEKKFAGRYLTIGRVANLTQAHNGRSACNYRNMCMNGCPYSAYFSSQSSTLPAAMATKKLTLRPQSIVNSILYDAKKNRAKGVLVIDSETGERHEFYAKIIFVCASTIGSTWLLLNSKTPQYPNGLGNSSGVLGHYLMDHQSQIGAFGTMEGFEDKYLFGRRPNGLYIPRYRNIGDDKQKYARGYGFQGGASRQGWQRVLNESGFGEDLKNRATEPGQWSVGLYSFGECLPYFENKMTLNTQLLDKWGQPTITFDAEFKENERLMKQDMKNDSVEMLAAVGCKDIRPYDNNAVLGGSIHEMGTARMGKDPKQSVLNAFNQMHDCKNVFVTDGSAMVSSSCVNPSLTYMALTARAVYYALGQMKKGEI